MLNYRCLEESRASILEGILVIEKFAFYVVRHSVFHSCFLFEARDERRGWKGAMTVNLAIRIKGFQN